MRTTITGWLMLVVTLFATPAIAATCGGTYTVKRGDSLSLIADALYKNAGMWTVIHTKIWRRLATSPIRSASG